MSANAQLTARGKLLQERKRERERERAPVTGVCKFDCKDQTGRGCFHLSFSSKEIERMRREEKMRRRREKAVRKTGHN